jgi:hypothetical protein
MPSFYNNNLPSASAFSADAKCSLTWYLLFEKVSIDVLHIINSVTHRPYYSKTIWELIWLTGDGVVEYHGHFPNSVFGV